MDEKMTYSLERNGDDNERRYYGMFIRDEFPSYEAYWIKYVVPVTNRPTNHHLKSNAELALIGKNEHDLCMAQLHYTVFLHLARVYDIRHSVHIVMDQLIEGMVRLTGAQDVAFELLERFQNPRKYKPWDEKESMEARRRWIRNNNHPLQDQRDYRNHLAHGGLVASIFIPRHEKQPERLLVPAIGKIELYLDWRNLTGQPTSDSMIGTDFIPPYEILNAVWGKTIRYFDESWKKFLL